MCLTFSLLVSGMGIIPQKQYPLKEIDTVFPIMWSSFLQMIRKALEFILVGAQGLGEEGRATHTKTR